MSASFGENCTGSFGAPMPIRIFVSSGLGSTFGSAFALAAADGAPVVPVTPAPPQAPMTSAAATAAASQDTSLDRDAMPLPLPRRDRRGDVAIEMRTEWDGCRTVLIAQVHRDPRVDAGRVVQVLDLERLRRRVA